MSVEGNLAKGLTYKIQGDFSRSPMLVDAFVKYKACNEFAIQVGQFKTPFSIESPINPVNLEIFDYGESVQKLVGYSDVCGVGSLGRDLGIMATGSLFPIETQNGDKFGIVDYSLGVFNGNGINVIDNTEVETCPITRMKKTTESATAGLPVPNTTTANSFSVANTSVAPRELLLRLFPKTLAISIAMVITV